MLYYSICFALGAAVGAIIVFALWRLPYASGQPINKQLKRHLSIAKPEEAVVREKKFPARVSPDALSGLETWLHQNGTGVRRIGVPVSQSYFNEMGFGTLLSPHEGMLFPGAIDYESFDVGEEKPAHCPKHVLWLFEAGKTKCAILWTGSLEHGPCGMSQQLRVSMACTGSDTPDRLIDSFTDAVEKYVRKSASYRGKILSFDREEDYTGDASGLKIHKLHRVNRDDVILPEVTIRILDRNVIRFVEQRSSLSKLRMPTKKGLLFYGPPGTGKTHTLHYLIGALKGHTTLLITAEQIGLLAEYMTLARLLQPTIVVIEDVDLIARDRSTSSVCEQSILNRLLNEMDGLREDAEILFLLTTNRPEELEAALAARPGRIDQAIEFPLPDARGREKLIRLYACGAEIACEVVADTARRTEGVSAAFIKELMRRSIQFHLECSPQSETPKILQNDVDQAIEELIATSGAFNRKILGVDPSPEWHNE